MHIFVTGLASFIGRELLARCAAKGIQVSGVDAVPMDHPGARVADIRSPEIAALIPEGVDAMIHLAALSRDPDCRNRGHHCFDINVMGTLALMEAAKARGVKQFVFASSEWVYDTFIPGVPRTEDSVIDASRLTSEYALSKFVSENNLRQQAAHGFCPATVLRFGIVYGPRKTNWSAVEALLNTVATQDEVKVGSRATARSFIHGPDVAEGIIAALGWTKPYDVFDIQGPDMVSLGQVLDRSAALLGRAPRVVESAPDTPSIRLVGNGKATAELGWTARIGLDEGLRSVAAHLGYI
jgi:UDP-glucose 4-epimerase